MANRVDPEQTPCSVAYCLGLHMTLVTIVQHKCSAYIFRGHLALPLVTEGS